MAIVNSGRRRSAEVGSPPGPTSHPNRSPSIRRFAIWRIGLLKLDSSSHVRRRSCNGRRCNIVVDSRVVNGIDLHIAYKPSRTPF